MRPASLSTDRLALDALDPNDAEALHVAWSDPDTVQYWHLPPPRSIDESRARVEAMIAGPGAHYWSIRESGDDRVIGHVGFPASAPGRRAPFGYLVSRDSWGRGLASEAASAALRAGLEGLRLAGAELWIYENNRRSVRVAEKLGCTLRGRFVAFNLARRGLFPTLVYGVTSRDLEIADATPDPVAFYSVHPVLAVPDIDAALDFYCGRLGFLLDWAFGDPVDSACVSRMEWTPLGATIRFTRAAPSPEPPGGGLAIAVDDVDRLAAELDDAGVAIADGPVDRPWGLREVVVVDPFGHRLQLVTPAR